METNKSLQQVTKYEGKTDNGGRFVGCVAVAIGQIMAYHRKNNHNKNYNWNEIRSINLYNKQEYYKNGKERTYYDYGDNKEKKYTDLFKKHHLKYRFIEPDQESDISKFLWDIAEGVGTDYGKRGSGSTSKKAARYFESAGYSISGYYNWLGFNYVPYDYDYDYDAVVREIAHGRPVYLRGLPNGGHFNAAFVDGHAWVADGYIIYNSYGKVKYEKGERGSFYDLSTFNLRHGNTNVNTYHIDDVPILTIQYIHMNWGWGLKERKSHYNSPYYLDQGSTGGWCTYDYWTSGPGNHNKQFNYYKHMIMVTPP